ncbi:MAG: hypothetical protein SVM80_12670 [Halobacteriota archaeon]|nr:hypothetical protein [Halobacteriota archaeon]
MKCRRIITTTNTVKEELDFLHHVSIFITAICYVVAAVAAFRDGDMYMSAMCIGFALVLLK